MYFKSIKYILKKKEMELLQKNKKVAIVPHNAIAGILDRTEVQQ